MVNVAYLMLLLPLAGFLVLVALGRRIGDPVAGVIGTVAVGGSFVVACIVLAGLLDLPQSHQVVVHNYFTWFSAGGLSVPVGTLVDPLSITMCMFITFVSAFIHLYSIGYMKGDRDYSKFFIYLNLFVFSMLLLVLADNLLLTFVGWEGVGVCSYWLVAFWFQRESAASAGKKAFIYNRIGDAGFLLAIFLLFEKTGTVQYESGPGGGIFGQLSHLGAGTATAAVLLLFLAATGKSAQIPLFNWLPDAMEGPTPVSALIHAATMVTAGVYLLCRMNPLLHLSSSGAGGDRHHRCRHGLRGGHHRLRATGHQEGARLLHGVPDRLHDAGRRLGRLHRRHLPHGGARLLQGPAVPRRRLGDPRARRRAGPQAHGRDPPLHEVDDGHLHHRLPGHRRNPAAVGLLGQGRRARQHLGPLQAAVGHRRHHGRAHGLLHEPPRDPRLRRRGALRQARAPGEPALHAPHESPWVMRLPLVVLAFFAFFAGALDLPWVHTRGLQEFLAPVFAGTLYNDHLGAGPEWYLAVIDIAAAFTGVIVAYMLWRGNEVDKPALEPAFLQRVWYWDDFYDTIIGRPSQRLATFCAWVVDARVIDGAVNGTAHLAKMTGTAARKLQTGYVRNYALGIALGLALIVAFMLSRTWWG